MFLMVSTILGPATVLMMIAGAFNAVFGTNLYESFSMAVCKLFSFFSWTISLYIDNRVFQTWVSSPRQFFYLLILRYLFPIRGFYLSTLGPAGVFLVVCMICKSETQLNLAAFMSACYAVIMMAVIVGTTVQVINRLNDHVINFDWNELHFYLLRQWNSWSQRMIVILYCLFSLLFEQRPRSGWWSMLSHMQKFLLLLPYQGPNSSIEAHIPASKLKSQPWGSNPSPEAQILASRLKSQPQSSNPKLKAQILASRPVSQASRLKSQA